MILSVLSLRKAVEECCWLDFVGNGLLSIPCALLFIYGSDRSPIPTIKKYISKDSPRWTSWLSNDCQLSNIILLIKDWSSINFILIYNCIGVEIMLSYSKYSLLTPYQRGRFYCYVLDHLNWQFLIKALHTIVGKALHR